jgi:hypothetical protein
LSGWSIGHAEPGLVALATALTVMALAFYGLQYLRTPLRGALPVRLGMSTQPSYSSAPLHNGSWLYTGTLAGIVMAAYTPLWFGLAWATQCAWGLVLFAQWWTLCGLWQRHTRQDVDAPRIEALCNSALLHVALLLAMVTSFGVTGVTAQ